MADTHKIDQLRYSLWLCPELGLSAPLQTTINQLAAKHSSLSFSPHMTVCSGITGNLDELTSKLVNFANSNHSLYLHGLRFSYHARLYQSLFIELTLDRCLQKFQSHAMEALELVPTVDFFPHISLAYIDPRSFDAQAEIAQLDSQLLLKRRHDRLILMETTQEQKNWKKIREFNLHDR